MKKQLRKQFWRLYRHLFGKEFFSAGYLFLNPDVAQAGMHPWKHYILHGRKEGRSAGWPDPNNFSEQEYLEMYPDVRDSGIHPWKHYVKFGKKEGRLPHRTTSSPLHAVKGRSCAGQHFLVNITRKRIDKNKRNCVVVSHDLSQTGCPINSWNMMRVLKDTHNVIAIALAGGTLEKSFRETSDIFILINESIRFDDLKLKTVLQETIGNIDIDFAVVNSIVSRCVLPYFALHRIPAIHFIHEFAYYHTKEEFEYSFVNAGQVVFSANIVRDAALKKTGLCMDIPVFPQGKSELPWKNTSFAKEEGLLLEKLQTRKSDNNEFVFLGVGHIEYRKGVDLFIRTAARIAKDCPSKKIRFIWAGNGWNLENDLFSRMLDFQIQQYGLQDQVEFVGPIKNMDALYEIGDALLMTSILDPLPGVVIEAMSHRCVALVFDGCSGFPELFHKNALDYCVADYLDVSDMAHKAIKIIQSSELKKEIEEKQFDLFASEFNMSSYIERIYGMVPSIKAKLEQEYELFFNTAPKNTINTDSFYNYLQLTRLHDLQSARSLKNEQYSASNPIDNTRSESIPSLSSQGSKYPEKCTLSVIVASYNYDQYIERTLNSLVSQTQNDFEIIVVDDGSKDSSVDIIKKFVSKHDNIHFFQHEHGMNKGLSATIQLALQHCSGEFVAFCESDDFWDADHVKYLLESIRSNPYAIFIYNKTTCIGDAYNKRFDEYVTICNDLIKKRSNGYIFKELLYDNYIPTFSSVCIKKDVLMSCNFDSPIKPYLDFWLYRQILYTSKIHYAENSITFWNRHDESYDHRENVSDISEFLSASNDLIFKNLQKN